MTSYQPYKIDGLGGMLGVERPAFPTVVNAVWDTLHDVSLLLGRTEDGVANRGADLSWAYTGRRGLNRVVMRSAVAPDRAAARVSDVVACFSRWSAPVTWVAGSEIASTELESVLTDAGFRPAAGSVGVAADLTSFEAYRGLPVTLSDLTVRTATSADDLSAWVHVNEGDGVFDAIGDAADVFGPANLGGNRRCRFYTLGGRATGGPVARVMSYVSGRTVGLYWLAARADHRGRGLELAIAAHVLNEARRAGARLAVTSTRTTDEPTWIEAGFTRQCQFKTYRWTPSGC